MNTKQKRDFSLSKGITGDSNDDACEEEDGSAGRSEAETVNGLLGDRDHPSTHDCYLSRNDEPSKLQTQTATTSTIEEIQSFLSSPFEILDALRFTGSDLLKNLVNDFGQSITLQDYNPIIILKRIQKKITFSILHTLSPQVSNNRYVFFLL